MTRRQLEVPSCDMDCADVPIAQVQIGESLRRWVARRKTSVTCTRVSRVERGQAQVNSVVVMTNRLPQMC